jgi:hypothetical protein
VPDARTVWLYREGLAQAGMVEALFGQFDGYLARQGYIARGGQILDASIVPVRCPPQHARREQGDQERRGARGLGRQARQAQPEGYRRALERGGSETGPPGAVEKAAVKRLRVRVAGHGFC